MIIWTILGSAFLISLFSLAGVLLSPPWLWKTLKKHQKTILAFISGVFLLSALSLFNEANHLGGSVVSGIGLLLGIVLVYGLELIIPESHHHHDNCPDCQSNKPNKARRILLGDALHNFGDGIVLATSFMVSPALGILGTISIASHEIVQEISEYYFLRQIGYTKQKALRLNFLSAISIIPGAIAGYYFSQITTIESYLLAVSSGIFLYIVFHDLLPEVLNSKKNITDLVALILGGFLIIIIGSLFSHQHDIDSNEDGIHKHSDQEENHNHL